MLRQIIFVCLYKCRHLETQKRNKWTKREDGHMMRKNATFLSGDDTDLLKFFKSTTFTILMFLDNYAWQEVQVLWVENLHIPCVVCGHCSTRCSGSGERTVWRETTPQQTLHRRHETRFYSAPVKLIVSCLKLCCHK